MVAPFPMPEDEFEMWQLLVKPGAVAASDDFLVWLESCMGAVICLPVSPLLL